MSLDDYLRLLDWAGRQLRTNKRGAIPSDLASILERLGIEQDEFLEAIQESPRLFPRVMGKEQSMRNRAQRMGRRWLHGVGPAARIFDTSKDSAKK